MNIKTLLECMKREIEYIYDMDADAVIAYHHYVKPFSLEDVLKFIEIAKNYIDETPDDLIYENREQFKKDLKEELPDIYKVIEKCSDSDYYFMSCSQFIYDFILEDCTPVDLYEKYWGESESLMVDTYIRQFETWDTMVRIHDEVLIMVE